MKVVLPSVVVILAFVACGTAQAPGPQSGTPPAAQPTNASSTDALRSWNDGAAKRAIIDFVTRVGKEGGPDFVPATERIATFDNDGTLWSEKPVPFQVMFAFDRVKAMAAQHPEWKTKQPFASVINGDMAGLAATGEKVRCKSWQLRTPG